MGTMGKHGRTPRKGMTRSDLCFYKLSVERASVDTARAFERLLE